MQSRQELSSIVDLPVDGLFCDEIKLIEMLVSWMVRSSNSRKFGKAGGGSRNGMVLIGIFTNGDIGYFMPISRAKM